MTVDSAPDPATPPGSPGTEAFPLFELSGSPAEVGLAYGRQAGEYIRRSVAIYQTAFRQKGVSWERALQLARDFMPQIERYNPVFMAEIEAIARGAELPVESLVAINARTEVLYGQRPGAPQAAETDTDGCTGAIAMPAATASGHTLHGQNWDWRDECSESTVVLRIAPQQGPAMLIMVEAGLLARCGLNSRGVAVTGNFLQTDKDYGLPGVPAPLIRRRVLMAETLAEAVRTVFAAPRAFANNLMISQSDGECINLEGTPAEVFWAHAEGGLLVHANHFTTPGALAKVRDVGLETNADSLYRDRRVRERLESRLGELTLEDFKDAFNDRYGSPRAVCRSPVTGPGGKTSSTVATVVMDTTARKMWIAKRPYEQRHFREYSLN